MTAIASHTTLLAATDLVSGSHSLYTIGVGVLVVLILLAGGARAAASFFGGRIGETVSWAMTAVIVAVFVGGRLRHLRLDQTHRRSHRHHHRPIRPITPTRHPPLATIALRPATGTGPAPTATHSQERTRHGRISANVQRRPRHPGLHRHPVRQAPTRVGGDQPLHRRARDRYRGDHAHPGLRARPHRSDLRSAATAAAAGAAALMPRTRPTLRFRLRSRGGPCARAARPAPTNPLLAPPASIIGNLSFTGHGVYAHYLISGLPYYLQSTKHRIGVADPTKPWPAKYPPAHGHSVCGAPNQRQLLRAMLPRPPRQTPWVDACRQMAPVIAERNPRTRIYWLAMPVDAGRAGHSPAGQATKVKRLAGRPRQRLRQLPGRLPATRPRHHHLPTRGIRAPTRQRRHARLVLAPQRLARSIHQPTAAPPQHHRRPRHRHTARRRIRRRRPTPPRRTRPCRCAPPRRPWAPPPAPPPSPAIPSPYWLALTGALPR